MDKTVCGKCCYYKNLFARPFGQVEKVKECYWGAVFQDFIKFIATVIRVKIVQSHQGVLNEKGFGVFFHKICCLVS